MKEQSILITGANGYIGSNLVLYLRARGFAVYSLDNRKKGKQAAFYKVDIADRLAIGEVVKKVKPDIIIHTAGLSNLRQCEESKLLATRINIDGTRNIIDAIIACGNEIKLIFISSEYVFDGAKGNYKEKSTRAPATFYGYTKKMSEDDIQNMLKNYIICRVANVYGRGGNFFSFLLKNINADKGIEVFDDTFYTPTYIDYLLDSLGRLIEKDYVGIVHLAGRERLSRYQFALAMAKVLGKTGHKIRARHQPKNGLIAQDSSLNSQLAAKLLKNIPPSIEKSLRYSLGDLIGPYLYREDHRGRILGITQNKAWREINYVESKKGTMRGGHYHRRTSEGFFIIEGKINLILQGKRGSRRKEYIISSGDHFIIDPGIKHTFKVLADSKWINMLSRPMSGANNDIH